MSRAEAIKEAFSAAAPYLCEFQHALKAGRLVICAQCVRFHFASDPAALGECRVHREAWPFVPFRCESFERREKKAA